MTAYYVYSPIEGDVDALSHYCGGGGPHKFVSGLGGGQKLPIDIRGVLEQQVQLVASLNVESVRIRYLTGHVCLKDTGHQDNGIQVFFYRCPDGVGLIGSVVYAHLKEREAFVTDDQLINRDGAGWYNKGIKLGVLPGCCGATHPCPQNSFCGCYGDVHIHMNAGGHGLSSVTRRHFANSCGWEPTDVLVGSWIYKFENNAGPCGQ